MTEKKEIREDGDYSFEPVPGHARKPFRSIFFILLGFTFFSGSMSIGARLGNGLDYSGFMRSVLLGGLFLAAYAGMLAYIGSATGLSFDLLARRAFGKKGSYLPSFLIALTQIGWFGVGLAMFALPAARVLGISPVPLVFLAGFLMTSSAYQGIRGMEIVSYVSVPLILLLVGYSTFRALHEGGGMSAIFSRHTGGMTLWTGIGLVIGSFVSGATTTPNFTRFAATVKSAVIATAVAFFLGNSLMFFFGAVGGAFTGKDDIFYVMEAQGLILPALIVLGANIWTTNDNGLYNGGLSLSNLTGLRKKPLVIAAGALGTLVSMWLYEHFVSWLSFLNAALPPIGAILILEFFLNREKFRNRTEPANEINPGALIGILFGILAGSFLPWGFTSVNAMLAACLADLLYTKTMGRNRKPV